MASFKYSPIPVIEQPLPSHRLSLDTQSPFLGSSEKGFLNATECQRQHLSSTQPCTCEEQWGLDSTLPNHPNDHRRCHNGRLRRFLLPAAIISFVLLLVGCAALAFNNEFCLMGPDGLVARALNNTTNNGDTFTKNKLYLIVIFVGVLVVIILAVMLSAWCCKGAFKNPLCCPCYLCACCGGLACLECIGCGLCAEGLSEM